MKYKKSGERYSETNTPKNERFQLKVLHLVFKVDKLVNLNENENLNENINISLQLTWMSRDF